MAAPDEIKKKVEDLSLRVDAAHRKKAELAALLEAKKVELSHVVNKIRAAGFDPRGLGAERDIAKRDLEAMLASYERDLVGTEQALGAPGTWRVDLARLARPGEDARRMSTLKKTLDDIAARFSNEILAALSHASVEELQTALPNGKGTRSRTPRTTTTPVRTSPATGHALEQLAVRVVGHLRKNGPTRSEDLRKALDIRRADMVKALALATAWKMVSKKGEKRATVYKALKQRGPKPQLTLGQRMRVAAFAK